MAVPTANGTPVSVTAVTSTVPLQRISSRVAGPTRGPSATHTPISPPDAAASEASTNTDAIGPTDERSGVAG